MKFKSLVPLIAAIALGLIAAVVARKTMLSRSMQGGVKPASVSVVVAKATIAPGTSLTSDDVQLAPIAGQTAPAGSFTNPAELVGRVTASAMLEGQPFVGALLAKVGTQPGLQALVPVGLRAVTIDVNESTGVGGLLAPGFHVDAITTEANADPTKAVSRVIVQNAPVVAVGQHLVGPKADGEKEAAVARTVTLLVTPHDAEALDVALASGRLRLVLRSAGDSGDADDGGVALAELLGLSTTVVPPPPTQEAVFTPPPAPTTRPAPEPSLPETPALRVVTVILGSEEHRVSFQQAQPGANRGAISSDAPALNPAIPQ